MEVLTTDIVVACIVVFLFGVLIYTKLLQFAREIRLGVDVGKPLLILILIFWGAIIASLWVG